MENTPITNYNELLLRIRQLKEERSIQKEQLKYAFEEFTDTLNPISIVKGSLNKLVKDKDVHVNLAKAGLNLGTNFIIEKVLGRSRTIKGFLSSILLEKISTPFINSNASKITSGISKLMHSKGEKETGDQ